MCVSLQQWSIVGSLSIWVLTTTPANAVTGKFAQQNESNFQSTLIDQNPILIATPENFNPSLRSPPPPPPKPPQDLIPPPTTTESTTSPVLENIQFDFRDRTDNFGGRNLFIEPTVQFRVSDDETLTFKTGFNYFDEPNIEAITTIPIQVGWTGKIGELTLQSTVGVDIFDRLNPALNFSGKIDAPIVIKVSPSGQFLSGLVLSGALEYGAYKFNAQTLENQITAWRLGPSLYWQIDRKTSFFSTLRWGSYNDGNSEWQSFSRLERQFGQFRVAANLFTWNYTSDFERTSGYFSPQDFLVYNAELAWEGDVFDFLRCRFAATLGQQRLQGEMDNANGYQVQCTAKISSDIEADLSYSLSNVRNQDTGRSAYGGSSLTGQVRMSF